MRGLTMPSYTSNCVDPVKQEVPVSSEYLAWTQVPLHHTQLINLTEFTIDKQ